jgi:hypothetical protein
MKIKLNLSHVLVVASALGLWAARAHAQYDVIVTPDQFQVVEPWNGQLLQDTAGAYAGDTAAGYYYINDYNDTAPSGTIKVPLPAGMPSGWHQYDVYEWVPTAHSVQWHVVDIAGDGTMNTNPTMPWLGQFGTNHQYLADGQNNQGSWLKLGSGPQSDSTNDGGYGVWMSPSTGNGYPYLQIHDLSFTTSPESFDAFRVVQIDAVPEPGTLALLAAGGGAVLLFVRRKRVA